MTVLGNVDEISRRRIVGWAYDPAMPNDSVSVAIHVNGREVGRCTAGLLRDGLKEDLGGEATGRYGFEFEFEPPLSVFQEYTVRVEAAGGDAPLPNGVKTLPAPPRASAPLLPIIVTSTGRAGTTLLMSEFAERPEIVVAGTYPFEVKLVAYYSAAFRALVATEDRVNSTDPITMLAPENRFKIGHNPYNSLELHRDAGLQNTFEEFFERRAPQKFSTLFRELIDEYYNAVGLEQNKRLTHFFAEKGDIDEAARLGARQFFDHVRELVVVRDPRDTLCSVMEFWRLGPAEALQMLQTTLPRLEEIHADAAPDSLFVRYEDLITSPAETRRGICRFLGLDPDAMPLPAMDPELFARHGTSARPGDSVQRWERELDGDLIAACDASFASYIERFGYDPAARTKRSVDDEPTRSQRLSGLRIIAGPDPVTKLLQDDVQLHRVLELGFGVDGNSAAYLGDGWSAGEAGYTWNAGRESRLLLARPTEPGPYRLRMLVRPFLWQERLPRQRLVLQANGVRIGGVAVAREPALIECDLPWGLLENSEEMHLVFSFPDAARPSEVKGGSDDRLLAFRFERLELMRVAEAEEHSGETYPIAEQAEVPSASLMDASSTRALPETNMTVPDAATAELPVSELMMRFESLGENCEFGLVQRRCGAEPLSLLRFASAPLAKLLAGLEARFEGLSERENLDVQVSSNGREYMVLDRKFQLLYHAWVLAEEMSAEAVRQQEARRLPLLVRKLIEDLQRAEKVFVFHGMQPLSEAEAIGLLRRLRSYGPNTLLWVELADADHPPGSVEWAGEGLLKAYIDRFAPGENAHDFSVDCWIAICRAAYRLRQAGTGKDCAKPLPASAAAQ